MAERAQRAAKNESIFREVNEHIAEVAAGQFDQTIFEAFCECSDPGCTQMVKITPGEYAAIRLYGDRFALIAGHDDPRVERVVERTPRFAVVEKFGEAAEVARDLDPRSG